MSSLWRPAAGVW